MENNLNTASLSLRKKAEKLLKSNFSSSESTTPNAETRLLIEEFLTHQSVLEKKNAELIHEAKDNAKINIKFNTNLSSIDPNSVSYTENSAKDIITLENDLVYIFAGGELPTQFLKKIGIQVTTKYGEAVLKHK